MAVWSQVKVSGRRLSLLYERSVCDTESAAVAAVFGWWRYISVICLCLFLCTRICATFRCRCHSPAVRLSPYSPPVIFRRADRMLMKFGRCSAASFQHDLISSTSGFPSSVVPGSTGRYGMLSPLRTRLTTSASLLKFYLLIYYEYRTRGIHGVTVTSFYIRHNVGGTQVLRQCYDVLVDFRGNYKLYEMHVLR